MVHWDDWNQSQFSECNPGGDVIRRMGQRHGEPRLSFLRTGYILDKYRNFIKKLLFYVKRLSLNAAMQFGSSPSLWDILFKNIGRFFHALWYISNKRTVLHTNWESPRKYDWSPNYATNTDDRKRILGWAITIGGKIAYTFSRNSCPWYSLSPKPNILR